MPNVRWKPHVPTLRWEFLRGARRTMWWLSFADGSVVIIAASSLAHARLLAAAKGFGRVSHFIEGNLVDTQRLPPIPEEFVGKLLSPVDARQLLEILNRPRADAKAKKKKK